MTPCEGRLRGRPLCLWESTICLRGVLNLKEWGRVAQLAEQCPFKAWVDGSSPSALTNHLHDILVGFLLIG